jgi:hypothetical protein
MGAEAEWQLNSPSEQLSALAWHPWSLSSHQCDFSQACGWEACRANPTVF